MVTSIHTPMLSIYNYKCCGLGGRGWGGWQWWWVAPTEIRVTTVGLMRKLERAERCMITAGGEIEASRSSLQYHRHTPATRNLAPFLHKKLPRSILIWIEILRWFVGTIAMPRINKPDPCGRRNGIGGHLLPALNWNKFHFRLQALEAEITEIKNSNRPHLNCDT